MFRKLLVALLALAMTFTTNASFTQVHAAESQKRAVFSIDAGRKYFSKEQIIQIIDKAYTNGYTDVQLILGNDGLRFYLDDMTIEANGETYTSERVKKALDEGNKSYYDDKNGTALTETEMNVILAHAKKRNINIIPLINTPGHMDAILLAMKMLGLKNVPYTNGYQTSQRTINLNSEETINFAKAFVQKYVKYFASKGASDIFNFGADEYANDVFGNPGWSYIQRNGVYTKFVTYVNDLCKIIKDAGMKPMCFNDGIYYGSQTRFGTFDSDLIISFWTGGWSGFNVAGPDFLSQRGHKILNTNDGWYWVLGRINSGGYNYNGTLDGIRKRDFNELPVGGGARNIPQIGSMQCVWCDEPSNSHDMDRIMTLMDKYSEKHANYLIRPANYTKVDEALSKVPQDLSNYTDESVTALNAAIEAVERNLKQNEQAKVDAFATAIETAITNLTLKPADYTAVDEAIAKANALDKDLYKDFSAVTKAIEAVVRDLDITKQEQVNGYATAINDAVKALVFKDADYTAVDEAIAKANALDKDLYKDFSAVTKAIEAVVRDLDITKQEQVNAYATAINDAVKALVFKDADYTAVDEAIAKAEALDKDLYKDFSAVTKAIEAVVRDLDITKQEQVNAYAKAINDAIDGLEAKVFVEMEKLVDFNKLSALLQKAKSIKADNYTEDSYKALTDMIDKAEKLYNSKPTQEQVDTMVKQLQNAIDGLKENKVPTTVPTSDTTVIGATLLSMGLSALGLVLMNRRRREN